MLYGRDGELAELAGLIADARQGRSGSVVVRGEAGIGKSSLLARLDEAGAAEGCTVLRAVGVEAESDLAFGSLHQLLFPVAALVDELPQPQARVLRAAFGMGDPGGVGDRFLVGVAVLSLLAEAAARTPVLCLVDDAHWLDDPSAQALLFAARRLAAEGVVVVFAARDEGFAASGVRQVWLGPLAAAEAERLLVDLDVAAVRRDRILTEAAGNPLALTEFARVDGVGVGVALWSTAPLPAPRRVLAGFAARVADLPARTRTMLLLAAADQQMDLAGLLRAAAESGVGAGDLAAAERAGLVEAAQGRVAFRHPLVRAAVYQDASLAERLAAHRALAATATSPDGRARHRAAAADGPDEQVAAELEAAAARALARGGPAAAYRLYRQAATLTPPSADAAPRLAGAARAASDAGLHREAAELAGTAGPGEGADLAEIQARAAFEQNDTATAIRVLREAGRWETAAFYAWHAGDLRTLHALIPPKPAATAPARMVGVLGDAARGDFGAALAPLPTLLAESPESPESPEIDPAHLVTVGLLLGDDALLLRLVQDQTSRARREGRLGRMPFLLSVIARLQGFAGDHAGARATVAEGSALVRDAELPKRSTQLDHVLARLAAIEGDTDAVRSLARPGPGMDGSHGIAALALLDLGHGRYEDVLRRLHDAERRAAWHSSALILACADGAEAAVRAGEPEAAARWAGRFTSWAEAGGQPWARGVAARLAALRTGDPEAFATATARHQEGPAGVRPFEEARTRLLHGQALRRSRETTAAREQLRAATAAFDRIGARPWADRARAELHAAGEPQPSAPPPQGTAGALLTPQELQVVRLAAEGASSRDIAARLFLSPRTVEYHLYKAYPKLGVGSRRELGGLNLSGRS